MKDELGTDAKNTMAYRASIIRSRLSPDFENRFPLLQIDLQPSNSQSRLAFYQPGHAFGVHYQSSLLPSDTELLEDLREMLTFYSLVTALGGTQELDTRGHAISEQGEEYQTVETLEEKRRLRYHYRVERNRKLAQLAKKSHGYRCQVCGFCFEEKFGELGQGFIEAHHLTPLAELPPDKPVKLSPIEDFAVVCSNCHRMIHRSGAPDSFENFKTKFGK